MKQRKFIDAMMITFATLIIAVAVYFFLNASQTTIASISGVGIVLTHFIPLPLSFITLILNIVLLIFGMLLIGKEFGIKTIYTSILLPVFIGVFEILFPDFVSFTNDQVLDALCYIVIVSFGQAMLFNRNASSGGIDIIGKIMNKYLHMEIGKSISIVGIFVSFSSILIADTKTVVISLLGTYFGGLVLDHMIFGSTSTKRVCILSKNKYQEIIDFILYELHSGATKYKAYGTYTENVYNEINVIVNKNEFRKLLDFVSKTDPDAFVTVISVSELKYNPKPIIDVKDER